VSRTPSHRSSGRAARPVDVRDTRWNPVPGWGPPTRLCTDPDCDGVMRGQGFHVPPMRGRGPARRYIPSNPRTVTVWTCLVCGRQSN
jgi:hypothetical protein